MKKRRHNLVALGAAVSGSDKTETFNQHRWQTHHSATPRQDVLLRKLVSGTGSAKIGGILTAIWGKPCTDRTTQVLLRHRNSLGLQGSSWHLCANTSSRQVFRGNVDNNTPYANSFTPPIKAQYVRLYPQVCRRHCTLRMELLGCELTGGTSTAPSPPLQPRHSRPCAFCPLARCAWPAWVYPITFILFIWVIKSVARGSAKWWWSLAVGQE